MTTLPNSPELPPLARHEGTCLLWAPQAILKGVLEADVEVAMIAGARRGPFAAVFETALPAQLLHRHGTRLARTPDAMRGLTLALGTARSGRGAIAMIGNDELDGLMTALGRASSLPLDGGGLCLLIEDDPAAAPASGPRQAMARLQLPCLEPTDVAQLRDSIDTAVRISRAVSLPVALVAHVSLLRSADTIELGPNRVLESADLRLARRRRQRRHRVVESGGALRVVRRLELNRSLSLPSPGERVPVGFAVVGPARAALHHLTYVLRLVGRVPVLELGAINPLDDVAVGRLLTRCEKVVVLEPRPGEVESMLVDAAERLRCAGERPATVWGRLIPSGAGGVSAGMSDDGDLHPSILVRRIVHLLNQIRPGIETTAQLVPDPPPPETQPPPRGADIGTAAAMRAVQKLVADVDQWLRERVPEDEEEPPTWLMIDGREPSGASGRIVGVEVLDHRLFLRTGHAALVQAARDVRPWILLICAVEAERTQDLERLAQGMVPGDRAERVRIVVGSLGDRVALRDSVREAALSDRVTVVVVRDGPPPRYDVGAIARALTEVDRLGFQPNQRLLRAADQACMMGPTAERPRHQLRVDAEATHTRVELARDEVSRRIGNQLRLRARPLLEEVEVIRTRPPSRSWRTDVPLPVPRPVHGRQPAWRMHVAGFRGPAPGLAARALCDAGRRMGYAVRCLHDPTAIGPGRSAWAQVLFTNPRPDEGPPEIAATIPYGEADLLLAIDAPEALRAMGPDRSLRVAYPSRTSAVLNTGPFGNESDDEAWGQCRRALLQTSRETCHERHRMLEDFAGACRAWFHTDRVTDLAVLGAAFQMGLTPVSAEAIEAAVRGLEAQGFGRSMEVFRFGRQLVVDPRLLTRPRIDDLEPVDRLTRRLALLLAQGRGGRQRASVMTRLGDESLQRMPGLSETDPGRQARRDFIAALYRCIVWGGEELATRFTTLVTDLYQADRGDRGRSVTRCSILPLADALLIRDLGYVAAMATSQEQTRRTRRLMNVKLARDDRLVRHFLTRIEVAALGRRARLDLRTGAWAARMAARLRPLLPARWRGTRRERDLRDDVVAFVERATRSGLSDYTAWADAAQHLHRFAAEGRLRGMARSELQMITEMAERAAEPEGG